MSGLPALLVAACLVLNAGCGGDDPGSARDADDRDRKSDVDTDADHDDDRARQSGSRSGDCLCELDEVCDAATGHCIEMPDLSSDDLFGEIRLTRSDEINFKGEKSQKGAAYAMFFAWEERPTEHLQEYFNEHDELCTVLEGGVDVRPWPSGPRLSAGRLTLEAKRGEGAIVLAPHEFPPEDEAEGIVYAVEEPAVMEGTETTFEDVSYLPLESTFEFETSGGDEIGALRFSGAQMPEEFEALSPAPLGEGDSWPLGEALEVSWSPAQKNAVMDVSIFFLGIKHSFVRCLFKDDGSARVPREAMPDVWASALISMGRKTVRYREVDADGTKVHLWAIGRYARVFSFCYGGGGCE